MAYDYKPSQINNWDFAAQAAVYYEKFEHQKELTRYWMGRARMAGADLQDTAA